MIQSIRATLRQAAAFLRGPLPPPEDLRAPEAEIAQAWAIGAALHLKGERQAAYAAWAQAMELQKKYAGEFCRPGDIRYLRGDWWTAPIGHIAHLDLYAKLQALGRTSSHFRILSPPGTIGNQAYLNCWRRSLDIVTDPRQIAQYDTRLNEELPAVVFLNGQWRWLLDALGLLEEQWEADGRRPLPFFSTAQIEQGWRVLASCGVPRDAWFVALHVREGGKVSGNIHHANSTRNASLDSYLKAMELITEAGGWVIRLGDGSFTPLPSMPRVIDYAHSNLKCDWLDVFLLSQCKFTLATNSGPAWVSGTFGVPTLLTNWAPLCDFFCYRKSITLPKLLWSRKRQRLLTFTEQFTEPFGFLESESALAELGLVSVANEADDIAQAVNEIMADPGLNAKTDPADQQRQAAFKNIAAGAKTPVRGRIGSHFLERHADLLEGKAPSGPEMKFGT